MLSYQYKIVYSKGFLVLERRKTLLGIIPLNSWASTTLPFNSVQTLNNICERRGIKNLKVENLEQEATAQHSYYADCIH